MPKKYYAVKNGVIPGIYQTWDEAQKQVAGFSGAKYKSFKSLEEAEKFIIADEQESSVNDAESTSVDTDAVEMNQIIQESISSLKEGECVAAVDGSFDPKSEKSGFGVIIISYGDNKDILYKAFTKSLGEGFIELRNVAAELEGVKEAVSWAIDSQKRKITIYYDYEGIEKWAIGEWRAKKELTKKYVDFIKDKKRLININFVKVPAHSGIDLNEEADALAKRSLLEKGHKTYSDGSVYFVGYNADSWKKIVNQINEELLTLDDMSSEKISLNTEEINNRQKITLKHLRSKVVINCYHGYKSYVQGKQTVLFQKIITAAVESLTTKQSVVETLNSYHALSITQVSVEVRFEELLPHFNGKISDKIYTNLLSAVYNTMLTGYMPDYTCLITPVFRGYEYCLHKILGEKMGLDTARDNGANNFSFFNKDLTGLYVCNNSNVSLLPDEQKDYLNDLYTNYNAVRHPYSHWSADDYDTAVIPDMQTAVTVQPCG